MKGLARFVRESLGVHLHPGQIEVLEGWERSGRRKAVLCLGRRSGKTLMAAAAAIFNAVVLNYAQFLRPSEVRFIVCVATREQQARELIRVIRELLAQAPDPELHAVVDEAACTDTEVVFKTNVVVRAMPASSRSTRGLAISLLILDEMAHMVSDTEGFAAARSIYRALAPSVAQFQGQGYILVTSTPLWPSGPFYELYRRGETGQDRELYVVRRPTWEVNAAITRAALEPEFLSDPDSARVEYGAEFLEGVGAFLQAQAIQECVIPGRRNLPPLPGVSYAAAADPAFAAGGDAFTFAIGHKEGTGEAVRYILDRLESWRGRRSPLNSDLVLDEIAELAHEYRVGTITLDQYAVIPLSDGLRRRGIAVKAQPLTSELKADLYSTFKRALNTGQVELLDDPGLLAELVHLEVRPSPSGKPRIGAMANGKDDKAMAVATLMHQLAGASTVRLPFIAGMGARPRDASQRPGADLGGAGGFNLDGVVNSVFGREP